jgi:hypothetical protein
MKDIHRSKNLSTYPKGPKQLSNGQIPPPVPVSHTTPRRVNTPNLLHSKTSSPHRTRRPKNLPRLSNYDAITNNRLAMIRTHTIPKPVRPCLKTQSASEGLTYTQYHTKRQPSQGQVRRSNRHNRPYHLAVTIDCYSSDHANPYNPMTTGEYGYQTSGQVSRAFTSNFLIRVPP